MHTILMLVMSLTVVIIMSYMFWPIKMNSSQISYKFEDYEKLFDSDEAKGVGKSIFYNFERDWTLNSTRTILSHNTKKFSLYENRNSYNNSGVFSQNDAELIHTLVFVATLNITKNIINNRREESLLLAKEIAKDVEDLEKDNGY